MFIGAFPHPPAQAVTTHAPPKHEYRSSHVIMCYLCLRCHLFCSSHETSCMQERQPLKADFVGASPDQACTGHRTPGPDFVGASPGQACTGHRTPGRSRSRLTTNWLKDGPQRRGSVSSFRLGSVRTLGRAGYQLMSSRLP